MRQLRVAVIDDYEGAAAGSAPWESLRDCEVRFYADDAPGDLAGFDVVVAMRERTVFDRVRLESLPSLRLLVSTGMGTAHIDVDAARSRGIVVSGTRGRPSATVELTWALILELLRAPATEDGRVRDGGWGAHLSRELHGKTLAIAGLGRIGSGVADVGRAFGMHVITWSPRGGSSDGGVERVDHDEFFSRGDVVSLHLRLAAATRHCVGPASLALMRPHSILVNSARSQLIRPGALEAGLQRGTPAAAAVDVFDVEPLPVSASIRDAPNLVLSAHRGYATAENFALFYGDAVEAIAGFMSGQPVRLIGS